MALVHSLGAFIGLAPWPEAKLIIEAVSGLGPSREAAGPCGCDSGRAVTIAFEKAVLTARVPPMCACLHCATAEARRRRPFASQRHAARELSWPCHLPCAAP
eukprot:scaffold113506_cov33-Tisochrysis_lutea.AAC.2